MSKCNCQNDHQGLTNKIPAWRRKICFGCSKEGGAVDCINCIDGSLHSNSESNQQKKDMVMELSFNKNESQFIIDTFKDFPQTCGFCQDEITAENLAGVIHGIGFVCNKLTCMIEIADSHQLLTKGRK